MAVDEFHTWRACVDLWFRVWTRWIGDHPSGRMVDASLKKERSQEHPVKVRNGSLPSWPTDTELTFCPKRWQTNSAKTLQWHDACILLRSSPTPWQHTGLSILNLARPRRDARTCRSFSQMKAVVAQKCSPKCETCGFPSVGQTCMVEFHNIQPRAHA